MGQSIMPTAVGSNAGLGVFITEAMVADATLDAEREGRAYAGYCPMGCGFTLREFHRDDEVVAKGCTVCRAMVFLKHAQRRFEG